MSIASEPDSMTKRALRHIRNGLATGQFRPGSQLSEVALAQEIGVSRTPIREAFILLESQGFLEQVPGYGTFIKKAKRHECESMYEMREILEAYAARKAALYMTDESIGSLRDLCQELLNLAREVRKGKGEASPEMVTRSIVADLTFHMTILRSSGNSWVTKIVSDLHLMSQVWASDTGDPGQRSLRDWAITWKEHRRIYLAIRRRDPEAAAKAMEAHLRHATKMALEYHDQQSRLESAQSVGFEWVASKPAKK